MANKSMAKRWSHSAGAARLCYSIISWRSRGYFGRVVSRFLRDRLVKKYGVYSSPLAYIGPDLFLPHPIAICIGDEVRIGAGVTIYQGVTLGRKHAGERDYPTIGDGAIIYAGAVIVGAIHVGENAVVGANSVVTKDVPRGAVVGGVPARLIRAH